MITLKKVSINKYKSIETEQSFDVEPDVTVLVGKNESGKTAILEAIRNSNSYLSDRFQVRLDFPRRELTRYKRSRRDVTVVKCIYSIQQKLAQKIAEDIGRNALEKWDIICSTSYKAGQAVVERLNVDTAEFFSHKFEQHDIGEARFKKQVLASQSLKDLPKSGNDKSKHCLNLLKRDYLQHDDDIKISLSKYTIERWIKPHLPKFLYYDEYYKLPADIAISQIQTNPTNDDELKTAKALFDLAQIDVETLLNSEDYESYKAELEATANEITQSMFQYWTTNQNLRVEFDIPPPRQYGESPVMKIRVHNLKYQMSLPLDSRSKGFNWFFSFLIWFSKIQVDREHSYVLLLDEPGLNLHASAQADLLRFIEDLANDYQVVYTTHSPFMVESDKLHRVRTVLETDTGTKISKSIQEKDPDTLFPLQAALGYDIAQNLFIGQNNLLVEGVSDLIYLQTMSSVLQGDGRDALREDITIVPVGGLDKVATFISLLRGQELNIVCLLDSFTDQKGKQRVDDMVKHKIIRDRNIRFFDEFAANGGNKADLEDMYEKEEYLKLFNQAFDERDDIEVKDLNKNESRIVKQIESILGKRYNHHRPANLLAKLGADVNCFSSETMNRFEKMFQEINKLFETEG